MENRAARGRARTRGARGVRPRGRGVQTRGGRVTRGHNRPSVSKLLIPAMVEDISAGLPLETPLHPRRVRVLATTEAPNPGAEAIWRSQEPTPGTSRQRTPPPIMEIEDAVPSPALFINYGSSGSEEEDEDESVPQPPIPRELSANFNVEWPPYSHEVIISSESTPVSPTPMEPSDKFKFDWRAFPSSPMEPSFRREPFSQLNCGPTMSFADPYHAFIAIWDREIMELIVRQTNLYAQQTAAMMLEKGIIHPNSRITKWQDTNVSELYTYLAIVMAMGITINSRLEEYWSKNDDIFLLPGFGKYMTYDRFVLLSKCLHFNNNYYLPFQSGSQARIFKIKPIVDHLNRKFSQLYILSQNVALDESLTMWKGWLGINQFIRSKAAAVGIKTYEVCESKTGYLWRFELYAGHDTSALQNDDDPVSGIIPSLVLRLLNGLEHKGHTVWMDNFYNSPALARELKTRGFDCVGTLRTNRHFVPSELMNLTRQDMVEGEVVGCTSGDVDIIVWRDKNRVAFISTYHGLSSTRCGEIHKPTIVGTRQPTFSKHKYVTVK